MRSVAGSSVAHCVKNLAHGNILIGFAVGRDAMGRNHIGMKDLADAGEGIVQVDALAAIFNNSGDVIDGEQVDVRHPGFRQSGEVAHAVGQGPAPARCR